MEQDPNIVRFTVTTEVVTTPERYAGFLQLMREVAIRPVEVTITDQAGNRMLFELPEQEYDPAEVSRDEFHAYYKHYFPDDKVSSLPAKVYNNLLRGIPDERKAFDSRGTAISVQSDAFMQRCKQVVAKKDRYVSGPKSVGMVRGFMDYFEITRAGAEEK